MTDETNKPADTGRTSNQMKDALNKTLKRAKPWASKIAGCAAIASAKVNRSIASTNKATLSWFAIGLAAIILLSTNIIVSNIFRSATADLTDGALYSISRSTRQVLANIREPIDVRIYFSDELGEAAPLYKSYFDRVRALLEQYENISSGKLRVSFIEPEPFSDAEDRAVAAGLTGVRLNASGDQGFFGLVATNSTDQQEIVQFFAPEREPYLEYDMTKLIHKLATPKKLVVGLMSGIPIDGGMSQPLFPGQPPQQLPKWLIVEQIEEFFDLKTVDMTTAKIPDDVDVLLIVQPAGMSAEAAYAVDQFALSGKSIFAFLDPVPDVGRALNPRAGGGTLDPEMAKLLTAWGVKFDPTKVAGDRSIARRVQFGTNVTDYVTWISVNEPLIADADVISDGVKLINFSSAGFLEKADKAETKLEPLLQTTPAAMEIPAEKMLGRQPDPIALLRDYREGSKPLILAARLTGDIQTAFPDGGPKPATDGDDEKANQDDKGEDVAESTTVTSHLKSGKLNAIIVGDTDLLYDQFWVQVREMLGQRLQLPIAHNAVFVVNALENLSGGAALAGLRGRGVDVRPFETVDNIRREAERRFRQEENRLTQKLEEVRENLAKVEQRNRDGGLTLSDEDKNAIDEFRGEMVATRQQLRNVKHQMQADIDNLEGWLKFINIAGVPILFGLGGMAFSAMRRRKAQRH